MKRTMTYAEGFETTHVGVIVLMTQPRHASPGGMVHV